MTVFKRVEETLDNMLVDPSNEKILTKIILFCTTHPESLQYKYVSFMNMLDVFLPPTMRINKHYTQTKRQFQKDTSSYADSFIKAYYNHPDRAM